MNSPNKIVDNRNSLQIFRLDADHLLAVSDSPYLSRVDADSIAANASSAMQS